jgi:hypothetical protein
MLPVRQTRRNLAINYCSVLSTQRPLDSAAALVGFPPVAGDRASYPDCRLGVMGGKTPSEFMFSELPQVADIVRSAFHHLANPLVLQITVFWVPAIPG